MAWHVAWGTRGVSAVLWKGVYLAEGGGVPASVLPIFLVLREDEDEEDGWEDEGEDENPFLLDWNIPQHDGAASTERARRHRRDSSDPLGCPTVVSPPPSPSHPPRRCIRRFSYMSSHNTGTRTAHLPAPPLPSACVLPAHKPTHARTTQPYDTHKPPALPSR